MEDNEIIELYWKRDEVAIPETDKKYGNNLGRKTLSKSSEESEKTV